MEGKGDPGRGTGGSVPQWNSANHVKGREKRTRCEQGFVKLEGR